MTSVGAPAAVATNGIRLDVAFAGPEAGPPVVLLHGFPEGRLAWRRQVGPLAAAGFRVLAPDQRGYGRSSKPRGAKAYTLDVLAADVVGLIAAAGHERAALVGHDWGGLVAWWVAQRHPERVTRLAILNAPHPAAFQRYLPRHPGQLLRSWYAFAFQLPGLPEALLRRRDFRPLAESMRKTSRPGTFAGAHLDEYRRAWAEPGALTAMLDWYRAGLRHPPRLDAEARVTPPTLILWGDRDRFLAPALADASLARCEAGRLERLADASHWLQHEEPERVNRALGSFLGAAPGAAGQPDG